MRKKGPYRIIHLRFPAVFAICFAFVIMRVSFLVPILLLGNADRFFHTNLLKFLNGFICDNRTLSLSFLADYFVINTIGL